MRLPDITSPAFWRGVCIGIVIYLVTMVVYTLIYP